MVTGCNVVLAHRLSATGFDKKGWTVYIKDFMKVIIATNTTAHQIRMLLLTIHLQKVLKKLEETNPERAAVFKANAQGAVKKILGSFKDWEMFTGESMDPEGSLAYMNYREDGVTPYIWIFLDGLEQEKV